MTSRLVVVGCREATPSGRCPFLWTPPPQSPETGVDYCVHPRLTVPRAIATPEHVKHPEWCAFAATEMVIVGPKRLGNGAHPIRATTDPDVERVVMAVGARYNIAPIVLCSRTRAHHVVEARSIAMYLCVTRLGRTTIDTARQLGGFDHSTVSLACRRIALLIATESRVDRVVHELTTIIDHHERLRRVEEGACRS